ncbi:Mrp/NBP35 family ATP-binding protein, partial [Deltaproteobacteria bacterium OttesenSCG-928-K17]|nr:Mrp/NBP35 family ATP-binding protein [Deltaproteobacteria bacterium OttesenSCG-928-K17]
LKDRDEAVIWRGPRKIRAIQQFFSETAWGRLDYLIIDSPPGTGDEPMAVLSTVDDVKPIAVTSGSRLSTGDVAKSLNFVRVMGREPFGLIDNQSWYVCPKCGEETDLYDRKASQALADEYNVPLLASLPMDLAAARAAEEGRPLVWSRPEHPFSVMVKALAEKL